MPSSLSIVIPAYNEAAAITQVLRTLVDHLRTQHLEAEVILVDDGSTDDTAAQAESVPGVRVVRHPYNKGYGAAIKTGIDAATSEWCITYDADNQHTPELIEVLLPYLCEPYHMVVGQRSGYQGPWIRQPGKKVLRWVANYLVQCKIPDLNSGLRAFRREQFLRYQHLFPDGFSLSTTSTVCFLREGLNVHYVPITIQPRMGKSTVRARHAAKTFMLIMRLIMLFSPLRIFIPASAIFGLLAAVDLAYEFATTGDIINTSSVALISLTSLTFFFGLLADQIAAIRRELGKRNA